MTNVPPLPRMSPPIVAPPPPPRKTAAPLVKVLAIIFGALLVAGIIVALVLAALCWARERERQVICGANLNGVSKALAMYGAENNGAFPMINNNGNLSTTGLAFDGAPASSKNVYDLPGTFPQDNLGLLVARSYLGWRIFLCPSTINSIKDRSAADGSDKYGLGSGTNPVNQGKNFIDYALQIPQRYTGPNQENKAWINPNSPADLAIMADRGPEGLGKMRTEFSPNHVDCENVLFYNGSVAWCDDQVTGPNGYKNSCGIKDNNIYVLDVNADGGVEPDKARLPGPADHDTDSALYWRSN